MATGQHTYFGKTAELVRTAKSASHLQTTIFAIVKALIAFDAVLVCALLLYAAAVGLPLTDVIPFALILLVASVPVALPATFTLATALGSTELACFVPTRPARSPKTALPSPAFCPSPRLKGRIAGRSEPTSPCAHARAHAREKSLKDFDPVPNSGKRSSSWQ